MTQASSETRNLLSSFQKLQDGYVKRLHVDKRVVQKNRKTGSKNPPITIQTSDGPIKCMKAEIHGPSTLEYSEKPLSCGARVFITTKAEVTME